MTRVCLLLLLTACCTGPTRVATDEPIRRLLPVARNLLEGYDLSDTRPSFSKGDQLLFGVVLEEDDRLRAWLIRFVLEEMTADLLTVGVYVHDRNGKWLATSRAQAPPDSKFDSAGGQTLACMFSTKHNILSILTPDQIDTELVEFDNYLLGESARCQFLIHDYIIQIKYTAARPVRRQVSCFRTDNGPIVRERSNTAALSPGDECGFYCPKNGSDVRSISLQTLGSEKGN